MKHGLNENPHSYLVKISFILLISLLFSFISHAEHSQLIVDVNEAQQCQLCQHNIDSPPELTVFSVVYVNHFVVVTPLICQLHLVARSYKNPPLRAPPVQKSA